MKTTITATQKKPYKCDDFQITNNQDISLLKTEFIKISESVDTSDTVRIDQDSVYCKKLRHNITPQQIEEMLEQRKKFKESRMDNFTITNTVDNKIIVIQDYQDLND